MSRRVTLYPNEVEWVELSVDSTPSASIEIGTASGMPYIVDWGDGNVERFISGSIANHSYLTPFTGVVNVASYDGFLDFQLFSIDGSSANWNFDLSAVGMLTELRTLWLQDLIDSEITGNLNSLYLMVNLEEIRFFDLPKTILTGDFTSFSSYFKLNLFNIVRLSNSSTIFANYDDILNVWQSGAYIQNIRSGITGSKPTTMPFNFSQISDNAFYLRYLNLSVQSMDNMLIAFDGSFTMALSPKTLDLRNNNGHSSDPLVLSAISSLNNKNYTVLI